MKHDSKKLTDLIAGEMAKFEHLIKAPEILKEMKGQCCFVCGQSYDKSPQVLELKALISSSLTRIAEATKEAIAVERLDEKSWDEDKLLWSEAVQEQEAKWKNFNS